MTPKTKAPEKKVPFGATDQPMQRSRPKLVAPGAASTKKGEIHPRHDERQGSTAENRIAKLEKLLAFEQALRGVHSTKELSFFLANEPLQITSAHQIFVLSVRGTNKPSVVIEAISNLVSVDRNAPAVREWEQYFSNVLAQILQNRRDDENGVHLVDVALSPSSGGQEMRSEKIAFLLIEDRHGSLAHAVVLMGSSGAGGDGFAQEMPLLKRLANTAQHAWQGLTPKRSRRMGLEAKRMICGSAVLCLLAAMFIPVSLTALAPAEIVAKNPQIVAAPIDGIVERVLVSENGYVEQGTPILKFVDTELSANLKIAKQKLSLAQARLQTARQNSFGSGEGRRDLATAEAELDLAQAEFNFAQAQFDKAIVKAPRSGMLILNRSTNWQGRPVSVGERIMEFADVKHVEARIDLPVSDAIVIEQDARVQLFLDVDPLNAIEGRVSSASYRAELDAGNNLAFSLYSQIVPQSQAEVLPRIGARGTAQIYGANVSLGFYLFRRPLSAIRQWVGW